MAIVASEQGGIAELLASRAALRLVNEFRAAGVGNPRVDLVEIIDGLTVRVVASRDGDDGAATLPATTGRGSTAHLFRLPWAAPEMRLTPCMSDALAWFRSQPPGTHIAAEDLHDRMKRNAATDHGMSTLKQALTHLRKAGLLTNHNDRRGYALAAGKPS